MNYNTPDAYITPLNGTLLGSFLMCQRGFSQRDGEFVAPYQDEITIVPEGDRFAVYIRNGRETEKRAVEFLQGLPSDEFGYDIVPSRRGLISEGLDTRTYLLSGGDGSVLDPQARVEARLVSSRILRSM